MSTNINLVAAVLLVAAFLAPCALAASKSPFAWTYSGVLGTSTWDDSYTGCATTTQSPINIDTSTVPITTPTAVRIARGASEGPIVQLNAMFSLTATNGIRADVWASDAEAYILFNNDNSMTSANRYVLHHIAVHFPAEHTYNGAAGVAGELTFQFYPVVDGETLGRMRTNGVAFSFPFTSTATTEGRLDSMLQTLGNGLLRDAGIAALPFYFPAVSSMIGYVGTMTYPPCMANRATIVAASPIALHSNTIALFQKAIAASSAPAVSARPVQPLNGRTLTPYTLTLTNLLAVPPTLQELRQQPSVVFFYSGEVDYHNDVYAFGAAMAACICGVFLLALLALFMERRSFVSTRRDTWYNFVTGVAVFGCAQPNDEELNDPNSQSDDGVEEEEGDEEEESEEEL